MSSSKLFEVPRRPKYIKSRYYGTELPAIFTRSPLVTVPNPAKRPIREAGRSQVKAWKNHFSRIFRETGSVDEIHELIEHLKGLAEKSRENFCAPSTVEKALWAGRVQEYCQRCSDPLCHCQPDQGNVQHGPYFRVWYDPDVWTPPERHSRALEELNVLAEALTLDSPGAEACGDRRSKKG
jgi:hypothetical protein